MPSNDHQTNKLSVEMILKIILNSPELNCSVFFSLYCLRVSKKRLLSSNSYAEREEFQSMSIHFLSFIGMMLGESTGSLFVVLLLPLIWHAKSFIFSCDACSSGTSAGTSVLLLFDSITNLFDP